MIWPDFNIKPEYKDIVNDALIRYKKGLNYKLYLQDYDPLGDYLNFGCNNRYYENEKITFDSNGIPKVKYGTDFYYNPVTIAQFSLTLYGQYIRGNKKREEFLDSVNFLISLQNSSGALPYAFDYPYYLGDFKKGWVSGMAQGQALSAYARAYNLSKDKKILQAGNECLKFLLNPISNGGTLDSMKYLHPSLDQYITFEEYPVTPCSYTLNGFLFTLFGLYDWWKVTKDQNPNFSNLAKQFYLKGIETTKHILKYYDIGGYTTYDLGHVIYNKPPKISGIYHFIHIYLLHGLYSISNEKVLLDYTKLWISYVDDDNKK